MISIFKNNTPSAILPKKANVTNLYLIAILALSGFTSCASVGANLWLARLSRKEIPVLVQTTDGNVMSVSPAHYKNRDNASLERFAVTTLQALFSWDDKVYVDGKDQKDAGWQIENHGTLTTEAYNATFRFTSTDGYRESIQKNIAATIPNAVFSNNFSTNYEIADVIISPHRNESGKEIEGFWKVRVYGQSVPYKNGQLVANQSIPLNRELLVKAFPPQPLRTETPSAFALAQGLTVVYMNKL